MNRLFFLLYFVSNFVLASTPTSDVHIRINQMGYLPNEAKIAILFSHRALKEKIVLITKENHRTVATFRPKRTKGKGWGTFDFYYEVDFSRITEEGEYVLRTKNKEFTSQTIRISKRVYQHKSEKLLEFMRQQRCGYNPFFDVVCHQGDGRSFYGPMPDSTFVDATGGWHDAGDQLKYLITGSYATAHMLKAYELFPKTFTDSINHLGQPGSNGIADVLDEAKWGLDWMLKLHPQQNQLIHQIADDRDHRGWKMLRLGPK